MQPSPLPRLAARRQPPAVRARIEIKRAASGVIRTATFPPRSEPLLKDRVSTPVTPGPIDAFGRIEATRANGRMSYGTHAILLHATFLRRTAARRRIDGCKPGAGCRRRNRSARAIRARDQVVRGSGLWRCACRARAGGEAQAFVQAVLQHGAGPRCDARL